MNRRRLIGALAGVAAGSQAMRAAAQSTPAAVASPVAVGADTFPVTIAHAMGETTVPAKPRRIVTLGDYADVDYPLVLGLEPVLYGFTNAWESGAMPWQTGLAGLPSFDASGDPDLEAIAAAKPDLIVAMPITMEHGHDLVSKIAPTVVLAWDTPWRDGLRMIARATGESARAEERIADAEAMIAAAKGTLAPVATPPLMAGFQYSDALYIWGENATPSLLLRDLGLHFVGGPDPVLAQLSLEQFDRLQPAEMLLSVDSDPDGIRAQEANPLFRALPAVKRGGYGVLSVVESRAMAEGLSPISLPWVLPRLIDLIEKLAAGEGKKLS